VHPDPFVSYVLRADAQLEIAGRPVHSDTLGLRVRPGPPPPAGAARLVVLGDSVAFGYGLADDETLAVRLEEDLRAVQGGQGRPVVARTVAMPGWNFGNAMAFLSDPLGRAAADIVVYIPIGNDLCDSDGLWETGQRRVAPDLANPDPLEFVRTNTPWSFLRPLKEQLEREDKAGPRRAPGAEHPDERPVGRVAAAATTPTRPASCACSSGWRCTAGACCSRATRRRATPGTSSVGSSRRGPGSRSCRSSAG
jgi:hypothetical protein